MSYQKKTKSTEEKCREVNKVPKWKGKKVSRKRYYDLIMYKEFREFVKAKQTVYAPRGSINLYVNHQEVANVVNVQVERPWDIPPFQWVDNLIPVSGARPTRISSIEEDN